MKIFTAIKVVLQLVLLYGLAMDPTYVSLAVFIILTGALWLVGE